MTTQGENEMDGRNSMHDRPCMSIYSHVPMDLFIPNPGNRIAYIGTSDECQSKK